MAKKSIPIEARQASKMYDLYFKAQDLHDKIVSTFELVENRTITSENNPVKISKLELDIKQLKSLITKVDTDILERYISKDNLEIVENNLSTYFETCDYIFRSLMSYQYADDLYVPVKKYLRGAGSGDPSNYNKWAKDEDELAKKFIGMLTHPNNIEEFKNQIRRMAMGTMSQKEFNKIFQATKHKMIPNLRENKFESFEEYKNYNL
jgi:hypothetical protein